MVENETLTENQSETSGIIRPLIISDKETVNQYCPSFRHLLFGFEANDVPCAMVVPPRSDIEFLLFPGAKIIEHPLLHFPLFYLRNRRNLFERIEEVKPGIIHCIGTARASLAKSVAEYLGIPAVITLNSVDISLQKRHLVNKHFHSIIVPSSKIGEGLKRHFSSEKINRVNFGTFADENCSCFASQNRLPSIIIPCPFDSFENLEPLLNAFRHLAVDGHEFVAVFMGSGPAEKEIRDFIMQTGLIQTVAIAPFVRPVRSVFRGCDILIHANYYERFEPLIIEAAGAGLAVAADRSNCEDSLKDGTTAVMFDRNDELSIYSAVQRMLEDKQMTRTLAVNLQNYLRENNSISSMISKLLKIYSLAVKSSFAASFL